MYHVQVPSILRETPALLLLFIVFGGFACLFPAALYYLTLAGINSRPRPTLVDGTSDFLGLLGGLSGFLIVGGPLALAGMYDGWRRAAIRGDLRAAAEVIATDASAWRWLWLTYFLLVVGAAIVGWRMRRRVTLIYQIEPAVGVALFADTCERCGLNWDRGGSRFSVWANDPKRRGRAEVVLLASPSSKHLTLDWQRDAAGLRERVEGALADALRAIDAPVNPAAGWLLGVATVLFAALVFALTVLVLAIWNARH